MPSVKKMKSGMFFTCFRDITPCQIPLTVAFTLLYILSFLSRKCSRMRMAIRQMADTRYPSSVNRRSSDSMLVPVLSKKVPKVLIWKSSVSPVTLSIRMESMALSVPTVPSALGKDTSSYRFSTPQRVNSPTRGITSEAAYDRKIAEILTLLLGFSPIGCSDCFHLHPRNICARIPNGNESSIHVQFISSVITLLMVEKLKSLYIQ